jgi:hydroxymethylglutaryl-CoA reductase (NADPH)
MELRRWPRKNDPGSIEARQKALGLSDGVTRIDLSPFVNAQEMLTGAAVIPVSVVGPLEIELGEYELEEPFGRVSETSRKQDRIFVPLAHTEGGLSASLYRGGRAAAESGGFRTYVLADRMTRASCFVCKSTEEAVQLARFLDAHVAEMRRWLSERGEDWISTFARLREVETHVVGPMCHVMWAFTTGDACGPNMMTRNAYALNMGYVMEHAPVKPERAILEANMGGDKKPSHRYFERGGHGKTVLVEATLSEEAVRRVLRTTIDDLLELSFAGTHGAVASGMQSVAFTPASAVAAIFAATGQDLGMVGTSLDGARHGSPRRRWLSNAGSACPGSRLAPSVAGRPSLRTYVARADGVRRRRQGVRFPQIVAAATLALEISASAAMATPGQELLQSVTNGAVCALRRT